MKFKNDIEKRLAKLRVQYLRKFVEKSQRRLHQNCVHNHEHVYPAPKPTESAELKMVPRRQVTLVVIQPQPSVRLCMYGSDNPATWPGDVCDSDEVSGSCKWFKARTSPEEARDEFLRLMQDDEYVFDNYRDMAALQWVLEDRIFRKPLGLWDRFILWVAGVFSRNKALPASPVQDLPKNIWDDNAPSQNP